MIRPNARCGALHRRGAALFAATLAAVAVAGGGLTAAPQAGAVPATNAAPTNATTTTAAPTNAAPTTAAPTTAAPTNATTTTAAPTNAAPTNAAPRTAAPKTGARRAAAAKAAPAAAGDPTLTVVAVVCSDYQFIDANRARNNLQETFRDLGPDSPYFSAPTAERVNPQTEETSPQVPPNCHPMPVPWTFTLGTGINGGTPADLSVVTDPFAATVQATPAGVPELSRTGVPTGRTLKGAGTIALTPEQRTLASDPSRLWIQGGTPTSRPTSQLNGEQNVFAFGALRCAYDVLNGDNVEWIQFQNDDSNVFCYAYYISPPPGFGTIVINKQLQNPPADPVTFPFQGDISFEPGGTFTIPTTGGSGSTSFIRASTVTRAGNQPWTVNELPLAGYAFVSLACVSSDGRSIATTSGVTATITLAEADTVTCSYVNRPIRAPGLIVHKRTIGGVGGPFGFTVAGPDSSGGQLSATTSAQQNPAEATGTLAGLVAADYTVTETLPPDSAGGTWALISAQCNGTAVPITDRTIAVTLAVDETADCTFTNTLTAPGTLTVAKAIDDPDGVRTGPVVLGVSCTDGQKATLSVPVGQDSGALAAPLLFNAVAICTVTETATGAGSGATVTTAVTVNTARAPANGTTVRVEVRPAAQTGVRFTDTYTAPLPPPQPPQPPQPPNLPVTGTHIGGPLTLGTVLLLLGGSVLVVARRRRS